jgi:hypothetical protein
MTRNKNDPTCGAMPTRPALLALCMVLATAILAKEGYSFLAIAAAALQILYPAASYAVLRGFGFFRLLAQKANSICKNDEPSRIPAVHS